MSSFCSCGSTQGNPEPLISVLPRFIKEHLITSVHIAKTLIALAIGFILITIFQEPHRQWVLISIVVIMVVHQNLGFQIERGVMRIVGTIIGAVCGILVLHFPQNWLLLLICLLVVSAVLIVFSEVKPRWRYITVLGIVTYIIITMQQSASLMLALTRVIEILSGIFIALFVSAFIHPIKSITMIQELRLKIWSDMYTAAARFLIGSQYRHRDSKTYKLEAAVRKKLGQQRELLQALDIKYRQDLVLKTESDINLQAAVFRYLILIETVYFYYFTETANLPDWTQVKEALLMCLNALAEGTFNKALYQAYHDSLHMHLHDFDPVPKLSAVECDGLASIRFSLLRVDHIFSNIDT